MHGLRGALSMLSGQCGEDTVQYCTNHSSIVIIGKNKDEGRNSKSLTVECSSNLLSSRPRP